MPQIPHIYLGGLFLVHTKGWTKIGVIAILKGQDLVKNLDKAMDPFLRKHTSIHMYTHMHTPIHTMHMYIHTHYTNTPVHTTVHTQVYICFISNFTIPVIVSAYFLGYAPF